MKITINMNEMVRVNLTEYGQKVLNDYIKEYPTVIKVLPNNRDFQLWELFQIFGEEMYNGNPNMCFENNEIELI